MKFHLEVLHKYSNFEVIIRYINNDLGRSKRISIFNRPYIVLKIKKCYNNGS